MLESLHRRPRGRALAPLLSELTGGRVPAEREPTPDELAALEAHEQARAAEQARQRLLHAIRRYRAPDYDDVLGPPSRDLLARIDEEDVAGLRERLDPELQGWWDDATPGNQERAKLTFAVHAGIDAVMEKTGLRREEPPPDVHAMARGPLAAGGDLWYADLLVAAAERCGVEPTDGARVLDFGCSSGRHLRVWQAWRPGVRWLGCDPNEGAIGWAAEHLPGIDFFVNPQEPPLDLPDASLDMVTAVSVWSHFADGAGRRWLAEMRRLIRPGGLLVLTTQGFGSVAFYLGIEAIPPEHAADIAEDLVATGHHYRPAFGEDGDWGVRSEEWGMAYMTMDWLAAQMTPGWTLALYEPTRIGANQDLVVLRREDRGGEG